MKKLSIIVPVYDEEAIVEELVARLQRAVAPLPYDTEFIFVDDGSRDTTLQILLRIQEQEKRINIVKLSRNWGHQNAYNAGLDFASGNAIVFMDGDLQDPPEVITQFVKKWEEGFEVVYAVKESRQEKPHKQFLFALFYRLIKVFSEVPVERQAGMFSLVSEKVLNHLKKFREKNKYYVGLRSFVGFRQIAVPYHRDERLAGKPKQSFKKLLTYALNAFFSFSFLPIRILTGIGFIILLFITFVSLMLIVAKLFDVPFGMIRDLPGWTTLVLVGFFIIGIQIVFMGVLGEYIARILDEVRNRPYYIVEQVIEGKNGEELSRQRTAS